MQQYVSAFDVELASGCKAPGLFCKNQSGPCAMQVTGVQIFILRIAPKNEQREEGGKKLYKTRFKSV
jgi:hypothetical protein